MKIKTLAILLIIASSSLNAQECMRRLDVSTENAGAEFWMIANYWINLIEDRDTEKLFEYWNPDKKVEKEARKIIGNEIEEFARQYLRKQPGHPGVISIKATELFYERTLYSCDESKIEYYSQIRIVATFENSKFYINRIELFTNKNLTKRDEQVNYIRSVGPNVPPPPPPPPLPSSQPPPPPPPPVDIDKN